MRENLCVLLDLNPAFQMAKLSFDFLLPFLIAKPLGQIKQVQIIVDLEAAFGVSVGHVH